MLLTVRRRHALPKLGRILCGRSKNPFYANARPALAHHLVTLEHLRQIGGLRGFGQRDPLSEFKLEAFSLFSDLLSALRQDVVRYITRAGNTAAHAGNAGGCPNNSGRRDHSIHPSGSSGISAGISAGAFDKQSRNMGQVARNVPVRVGQKIQALPRCRAPDDT